MVDSLVLNDELVVLDSCYGAELGINTGAWGKGAEVAIKFLNLRVMLIFTIPSNYPAASPKVHLSPLPGPEVGRGAQALGIEQPWTASQKELDEIAKAAQSFARDRLGEGVLFDCASLVENALKALQEKAMRNPRDLHKAMLDRQAREEDALRALRNVADEDVESSSGGGGGGGKDPAKLSSVASPVPSARTTVATPDRKNASNWIAQFVQGLDKDNLNGDIEGEENEEDDDDDDDDDDDNEKDDGENKAGALPPRVADAGKPPLSRYESEFEEVSHLGSGGSGIVVKARHRLDRRFYAIKKISLGNSGLRPRIQREVALLSSLTHKNIVRYQSAWLEELRSEEAAVSTRSGTSPTPTFFLARSFSGFLDDDTESDSDEDEDDDNDRSPDFVWDRGEGEAEVEDGAGLRRRTKSEALEQAAKESVSRTLCIQMEFCSSTLKAVIESGTLFSSPDDVARLFRQCLEGLAYVHRKRILHRDLKPANIFIDADGYAKLGDFGLAVTASKSKGEAKLITLGQMLDIPSRSLLESNVSSLEDESIELTRGIGTTLYRAPEQEEGYSYDDSADMYSMGIILFEMCTRFGTGMERIRSIQSLREKNIFPDDHRGSESGKFADVIAALTKRSPQERPKAAALLTSPLFPATINLDEVNQAIVSSESAVSSIITSLFQQQSREEQRGDAELDSILNLLRPTSAGPSALALRNKICHKIEAIFTSQGAQCFHPPIMQTRANSSSSSPDGTTTDSFVEYLDRQGSVVTLTKSHVSTLARSLSLLGLSSCSLYHLGLVYSSSATGAPRSSTEAAYVVSSEDAASSRDLPLVEVLMAALGLAHELGAFLPSISIKLTDARLFDSILFIAAQEQDADTGCTDGLLPSRVQGEAFFSKAVGAVTDKDLMARGEALGLSPNVVRRLVPFYRALVPADLTFDLLKALEAAFFSSETVVQLKRHAVETGDGISRRKILKHLKAFDAFVTQMRIVLQSLQVLQERTLTKVVMDLGLEPSEGLTRATYFVIETAPQHQGNRAKASRPRRISDGGDMSALLTSSRNLVACCLRVRVDVLTIVSLRIAEPLKLAEFVGPRTDCLVAAASVNSATANTILFELRSRDIRSVREPSVGQVADLVKTCRLGGIPFLLLCADDDQVGVISVSSSSNQISAPQYMSADNAVRLVVSSRSLAAGPNPPAKKESELQVAVGSSREREPKKEMALLILSNAAANAAMNKNSKSLAFREQKMVEGKLQSFLATLGSTASLVYKNSSKDGHTSSATLRRGSAAGSGLLTIALDVPHNILRGFITVLSEGTTTDVDDFISQHKSHKRSIKALQKEICPEGNPSNDVFIYSIVDDKFLL